MNLRPETNYKEVKEKTNKYKIVSSEELISLLETYSGEFIDQIDYNQASIEKLNNDSFALISGHGENGIIFYNKKIMDSMIQSKCYPEETDSDDFFDVYKDQVKFLKEDNEKGLIFFEEKFQSITTFAFDYKLNSSFLLQLENKITEIYPKNKKLFEEFSDVSWILINEAIRKAISGKWMFEKEYTLNTFLTPLVVDKHNSYLNIRNYIEDYAFQTYPEGIKNHLISFVDSYIVNKHHPSNVNHKEMNENLRNDFDTYFHRYLNISSNN